MADLPDILELDDAGESCYLARQPAESAEGRDVVFSGQYLAQMLMAADRECASTKDARSIHAVFARPGTYTKAIELRCDTFSAGRTFGATTVTAVQEGKALARGTILLHAVEPDLLRHEMTAPSVPSPESLPAGAGLVLPGVEVREVDDPAMTIEGARASATWMRYCQKVGSVAANQAVLSWGTNGALIGLAMRDTGVDITQAHRTISTGVIAQTVHFLERFDVSEWLLMTQHAIHAGNGRVHGRGLVHTEDGRLVATFHQDSMARGVDGSMDPTRGIGRPRVFRTAG